MDVDPVVVGTGSKEAARCRPATTCQMILWYAWIFALPESIDASIVTFELVHDVQIVNPLPVAIYRSNVRMLLALLADFPLE